MNLSLPIFASVPFVLEINIQYKWQHRCECRCQVILVMYFLHIAYFILVMTLDRFDE